MLYPIFANDFNNSRENVVTSLLKSEMLREIFLRSK